MRSEYMPERWILEMDAHAITTSFWCFRMPPVVKMYQEEPENQPIGIVAENELRPIVWPTAHVVLLILTLLLVPTYMASGWQVGVSAL